jgi:cycloartenol synthase
LTDLQIHARGGITYITSWGKFWLAVLGCFSHDGLNPVTPEMWLLPYGGWTGVGWLHPGRYWCHCRMVYLPMSYLYGRRAVGPLTDVVLSLRCVCWPSRGLSHELSARSACMAKNPVAVQSG